MKEIETRISYGGGQSRCGLNAVDYMLATVDGVELYVEAPPVDGDEVGTFETLKSRIIGLAAEKGIELGKLQFWYDEQKFRAVVADMFF